MEYNSESFDACALIRRVVSNLDVRMDKYRVEGIELDDDLLAVFVEQLGENVVGIRDGLAAGNLDEISRQAHSIKGMSGSIGVPELSVLGYELEEMAKAGNKDRCADFLAVLEQCLQGYQDQLV